MKRSRILKVIMIIGMCISGPLSFIVLLQQGVALWIILISVSFSLAMVFGVFKLTEYLLIKIGILDEKN